VSPALALLDRDGTLNARPARSRYLVDVDGTSLLVSAAQAVRRLNLAGVPVAVVTNQRGLATGELSPAAASAIQDALVEQLERAGARVDSWHVCPHDVGVCDCRKPKPGLLSAAMALYGVAPSDAVMVGDSESDVLAGKALGTLAVLLADSAPLSTAADVVVPDLGRAVSWMLGELR
jgi:D-glycero-D-manno-heptose 1,7-bisphosphate phosphatase